jgi:hypothetical protein
MTCPCAGTGRKKRVAGAEDNTHPRPNPDPPTPKGGKAGKKRSASADARSAANAATAQGSPYSPSQSVESMDTGDDWTPNLAGVKELFAAPPPSTIKEEGVPGSTEPAMVPPPPLPPPPPPPPQIDAGGSGDLFQRAKEYIQKIKAKNVAEIKSKMAKDKLAYYSIRARNAREMTSCSLTDGRQLVYTPLEGMVEMGECRLMSSGLKLDLKKKRIVTTSFNKDWSCLACGPHGNLPAFNVRGGASGTGGRQVVILADQCFPPILPASGEEKCLIILRIENGGLPALVDEFLDLFGNRLFPAGSVILVSSPSHLAQVGLSSYVEDLLATTKKLEEKLGKETRVRPLPLLLLPGCQDPNLVRELFNLEGWIRRFYAYDDYHLEESHATAGRILRASGEGEQEANKCIMRYRLPDNRSGTSCFFGGMDCRLPAKIRPATIQQEKEVIQATIQELRDKHALDLDSTPSFERGVVLQAKAKITVTLLDSGERKRGRSDSLEAETRGAHTGGHTYRGHSRGGPSTAPGRAPARGGQYRGWSGGQRGHYKRGNRGYN